MHLVEKEDDVNCDELMPNQSRNDREDLVLRVHSPCNYQKRFLLAAVIRFRSYANE